MEFLLSCCNIVNKVVATAYVLHHYYQIVIWPDPVSTSQVDHDLVMEVAEVRERL